MKKEQILKIVVEKLKNCETSPEVDLDQMSITLVKFEDLRLDSLEILEFSMELEEQLKIELEVSEFPQNATISDFVDYISTLVN